MTDSQQFDCQFKIILIGESGVGKTSLINRYCKDEFSDEFDPTVGINYQNHTVEIDGRKVRLNIWDTAGQEKFKTLTRQFYRKVDGAILCYSITDKNTLERLEDYWIKELEDNTDTTCHKMIVGTMLDIRKEQGEQESFVSTEEGSNLAQRHGTMFIEASSKSSEGVENAFEELIRRILSSPTNNSLPHSVSVDSHSEFLPDCSC